jgi:Flp pilus assembly secretin CpaC
MARRAIFHALFGILIFSIAAPAAEKAEPDERTKAIALLTNLIRRTVPTASITLIEGGGDSAIILCGTVAHVEDVDTVLTVARAVWGENGRQVICGLKVGQLQQVQIDLKLYRIDSAGAEAADGELYRRYLESFGKGCAASENQRQLDETLLQQLESIGQAEFLTDAHIVTLTGRTAEGFLHGGDSRVPDLSGFGHEWIVEDHLKGDLLFLPVVLPDGRIRLSIEMKYPDLKVFPLGMTTLEDGETTVLAVPDGDLEIRGKVGDIILLATVHVEPVAP